MKYRIVLIALALLALTACHSKVDDTGLPAALYAVCVLRTPTPAFDDFVDAHTDIVRGIVRTDRGVRQYIVEYREGTDIPRNGANIYSLDILEVYKGDLVAGDAVEYAEPYIKLKEDGVERVYYFVDYLPSTPDTEYIFYFNRIAEDLNLPVSGYLLPSYGALSRQLVTEATTDMLALKEMNPDTSPSTFNVKTMERFVWKMDLAEYLQQQDD